MDEKRSKIGVLKAGGSARAIFRFVTMHTFDRQTDGRAPFSLVVRPRWHSMQRGKKDAIFLKLRIDSTIYVANINHYYVTKQAERTHSKWTE